MAGTTHSPTPGRQLSIQRGRPGRVLRFFLRFPILLYRLGLGGLFGQRFLLLTHTGRRSGRPRRTVVEVLRHEAATFTVAAAWGERSDWFRNIRRRPEVVVTVGRSTFPARALILSLQDGAAAFLAYAHRYPTAFRALTRTLTGSGLPATREACMDLARLVPVVAFQRTTGPRGAADV